MAGNGRRYRSRWDNPADVAQTVRAGAAKCPKNLMSRPANGWLTALLRLDVEQLKEAVAAPPPSNAAVTDGRKPSLGRQMRPRRRQRVAGAFPRG
jgi:hypothetical protein